MRMLLLHEGEKWKQINFIDFTSVTEFLWLSDINVT